MTPQREVEMHELARQLEVLTRGEGWEAMRYFQIGSVMEKLADYCATCDCRKRKSESPRR